MYDESRQLRIDVRNERTNTMLKLFASAMAPSPTSIRKGHGKSGVPFVFAVENGPWGSDQSSVSVPPAEAASWATVRVWESTALRMGSRAVQRRSHGGELQVSLPAIILQFRFLLLPRTPGLSASIKNTFPRFANLNFYSQKVTAFKILIFWYLLYSLNPTIGRTYHNWFFW